MNITFQSIIWNMHIAITFALENLNSQPSAQTAAQNGATQLFCVYPLYIIPDRL